MAKAADPIVIKKYANRRLYNTATSAYVTLEDLTEMVRDGDEFVVNDAKTGEDITHLVLTQIIFELENKGGQTMLPVSFLRQLISYYGDQMQMVVPSFLEQSMMAFAKEQERFRDQITAAFGANPLQMMDVGEQMKAIQEQTQRNVGMFADAMKMFTPFPTPEQSRPETAGESDGDELADLKVQIAEMQAKLNKLG